MKDKTILTILAAALAARLVFFFSYHPIWWDSAAYIGTGKFLISNGAIGIFEFTRPLLWPFVLGIIERVGLPIITSGRILILLLSIATIYLTYDIGKEVFSKRVGALAAIILSFTPTYFFFTYRLYNHIPAVFLSMLAIWVYLKKKDHYGVFIAGLILAAAFQTRFPQGAFVGAFMLFFLIQAAIANRNNALIDSFFMGSGFLIGLLPTIIFNTVVFQDALFQIKTGAALIRDGGWIFNKPWYFYLQQITAEQFLYLFTIIGAFLILRKHLAKPKNELLILLLASLPLLYYQVLPHKEMRFLIAVFPLLAILAGYGLSSLGKLNKKHILTIGLIVFIGASVFNSFSMYVQTEPKQESQISKEFYRALKGINPQGEVLISMPQQALDINIKPKMMYYPLYTTERIEDLRVYTRENKDNIEYIFLDTAEGGTLCHPEDQRCHDANKEFIEELKQTYHLEYYRETSVGEYYIFHNLDFI